MNSNKYRWGIIGPGKIAIKFAEAAQRVEGAELHAVASRDEIKAKTFAEQYGIKKYYGTYEALAADSEVDIVYIATPHTYHHSHAILCMQHAKHVLCEKPMSVNFSSTAEMINTAKSNNVFFMEAMWTRFL